MAATIKQVAAQAGVSTATVSYVLNGTGTVTEATRQRVMAAVAELGYQPSHAARSLRGRSYTLGLSLAPVPGRLADPAVAEVLASLADAAATRGYYLLLAAGEPSDQADVCVRMARTGRVEGVVLLDLQIEDERAQALCEANIPHVCAGPVGGSCQSPSVSVDGHGAARMAVEHLLQLGHRRIGLIQLPSEMADSEPRYNGYVEALEAAGAEAEPVLVVEAGRREEDGYQAMNELLGLPEAPTAVLACSDELAFGAMHALYDAGRDVGNDVSLIGFDNVPLAAHTHPPLTTLRQPRRALGEHLATLLIDGIEGRLRDNRTMLLQARLIVRRSTGPYSGHTVSTAS